MIFESRRSSNTNFLVLIGESFGKQGKERGQVLPFTFATQIYPAGPENLTDNLHKIATLTFRQPLRMEHYMKM